MTVKNVKFIAGKLLVETDVETREYDIANYLRAADIPADLTISSLTLLTTLAQVVMVLVKDLVDKDVVQEELVSGFDLQYILETLIDTFNAEEI